MDFYLQKLVMFGAGTVAGAVYASGWWALLTKLIPYNILTFIGMSVLTIGALVIFNRIVCHCMDEGELNGN